MNTAVPVLQIGDIIMNGVNQETVTAIGVYDPSSVRVAHGPPSTSLL